MYKPRRPFTDFTGPTVERGGSEANDCGIWNIEFFRRALKSLHAGDRGCRSRHAQRDNQPGGLATDDKPGREFWSAEISVQSN